MDPFNIIVGLLVLVLGSLAAIWWWRLARKIAPYRDEVDGETKRDNRDDEGEVIVLPPDGGGSSGRQASDRSTRP